ncbi:MAG: helix-turn-helix transcriptional regulator [Nitrososphaerota archaeon]|nr:helix-turn-helix transcriptional regulator [Nitrososphaerota archaeon]MDG7046397.1 helix-turn-helix transcriptional regulator [Nitrososphaerota archaeon]MDG7048120.1 helix-turn-helix transcriptional regulator [Nitrososphaerota archaeon]
MSEKACMIAVDEGVVCLYPSEKLFKLLGKDYTLLIIGLLGNNNGIGFNEIKRSIGNPQSNLLSIRLKELEYAGLLTRYVVDPKPITVKYSLTDRGVELRKLMIPLFKWMEVERETMK